MNAHVPPEHRLMPPIGVYAIPVAPATTDDRALARIYDELAEYLDTVYHLPGRDELRNLAALHGWSPRTPFTATRWQNRHGRQVILVVADHTPSGVERCDHGRATMRARPWSQRSTSGRDVIGDDEDEPAVRGGSGSGSR